MLINASSNQNTQLSRRAEIYDEIMRIHSVFSQTEKGGLTAEILQSEFRSNDCRLLTVVQLGAFLNMLRVELKKGQSI